MSMSEKKTIMIVDDMISIIEHAKQLLKEEYKVLPCTSGTQALEIVEKVHPDLILLDVNMPDIDGFEVMKRLKEMESVKDIPVIFITSTLSAEEEEKGFILGAADFLMKPFTQVSMFRRVKMHI